MDEADAVHTLTRRRFVWRLAAGAASAQVLGAAGQAASGPAPAAGAAGGFPRKDLPMKARPFPMTQVQLGEGLAKEAQEVNRRYLHRLPAERLLHNFRVNAGLPSSAGGWEKPDVELRGHFTGHYLSACALMYASTGDAALKGKADAMVADLARCQEALKDGYLSAFPLELFDRLKARKRVWAPFYTIHKIMAGMLDMYEHCGNRQALAVLEGMAGWVDRWTQPLGEEHMQEVLKTEFGGMNEVLYSLYGVTGNARWAEVAQRFDHKLFFDPLALRHDELKGLHVNTQVPKVIGAARRHELSQERRYHDIADFFWYEVTSARAYSTGGTSNGEHWLTGPLRLAEELSKGSNTTECCVAYNMLKLTRHLYQWTADPRYFDYYERTLFNHRLGTIHPETGGTTYYLPLASGSWKVFSSDFDSCWCCTGTGIEEFSKLNDSIYFQDDRGVFVNLFIASELSWPEKGIGLRQETRFPEQEGTSLIVQAAKPVEMTLRIRVPWWAVRGGSARLNGVPVAAFASPGSYLTLSRTWRNGDRVDMSLPMSLRAEPMPDDPTLEAILYGPLVLAGPLEKVTNEMMWGRYGPDLKKRPLQAPEFRADASAPGSWIQPVSGAPLTFRTVNHARDVTLVPLYKIFGERYAVYWRVHPRV